MAQNEENIASEIKGNFKERILETKTPRGKTLFITVSLEAYKELARYLAERLGITHISTMTGMDTGNTIDVLPHFFGKGIEITLRVSLPRDNPKVDTISDIYIAAALYEREIHDMLGVQFEGHPNLERLLLPDEWPDGVYPLRKDFKSKSLEPIRKI